MPTDYKKPHEFVSTKTAYQQEGWEEEFDKKFICEYECRSQNETGEKCDCQMKGIKDFIRLEKQKSFEEGKRQENERIEKGIQSLIAVNQQNKAYIISLKMKAFYQHNIELLEEVINKYVEKD